MLRARIKNSIRSYPLKPSGGGFDPSAQAFITAAGITGATQQAALNQLVLDLKTGQINGTDNFSSHAAIYPFCPIDDSTATEASYKWNLVNPLDTDAAYRITWNNSPTITVNGVQGNGSSSYGDTHCTQTDAWGSINLAAYGATTNINGSGVTIGLFNANGNLSQMRCNTGQAFIGDLNSVVTSPNGAGNYTISRTASNLLTLYFGGSSVGTDITLGGSLQSSPNFMICARGFGASADQFCNDRITFAHIANTGLTASQVEDLHDAIDRYNTSLLR